FGASFIAGPYVLRHTSSPAYQPACSGVSSGSNRSLRVMNATPRGEHSHLYVWQTVTSNSEASTGSTPAAWVKSHIVYAPWRAAVSTMAAASEPIQLRDCTIENATSQVRSVIESASAVSGTVRTVMSGRWRNGNMSEEKSPSMHSTSAP